MSIGTLTSVHLWWWGMKLADWAAHGILTGRAYGGFWNLFLKFAERAPLHWGTWNLFFFVFLFWRRPLWLGQGPAVMFGRGRHDLPSWVFMLTGIWMLPTYLFGNYQSLFLINQYSSFFKVGRCARAKPCARAVRSTVFGATFPASVMHLPLWAELDNFLVFQFLNYKIG